ncbi:MAG: NAD-dependent epimerase/dehydratase family protein [Nanobdellota archaeon]
MSEKILVTGGAGFVGSYIVDELVNQGKEVKVMDDLRTGRVENIKHVMDKISFLQESVLNQNALDLFMKDVDTVYHLAAEVGVNRVIGRDKDIWENDYIGTEKALNAAVKNKVRKFLFTSTSEVYGKFDQEKLPMRENSSFVADTVYGKAKLDAENLVSEYAEKYNIAGISTRYFNAYGPRQTLNGYCVPHFIDAAMKGENIEIHGDGSQTRDLTYVDDAVALTMSLLDESIADKAKGDSFNIGTGLSVSMLDLSKKIIEMTGSDSEIVYKPKRRPADGYHKLGDATKILETTGLGADISLEEGLQRTIFEHQEKKAYSYRKA